MTRTWHSQWMTQKWSKNEHLAALASFVPLFSDPEVSFGAWAAGTTEDAVITLPWFDFSDDGSRFLQTLYDYGYVWEFDWPSWCKTAEAEALRDDPDALAGASEEQLARLLTALARADRFCEGALSEAYDSGLLLRIVRRAAELMETEAKVS
jgi:hypothetical protein